MSRRVAHFVVPFVDVSVRIVSRYADVLVVVCKIQSWSPSVVDRCDFFLWFWFELAGLPCLKNIKKSLKLQKNL